MSHETARLITDANYREFLQQQSDAGMVGFGALPRQTQPGGIMGVPMMAEKVPLIPESEWPDRIRHMTANKLWIGDRWKSDPQADYQNGFYYCWAYSLSQAAMAVRAAQGQKFVQLSPESLAEDVNYRNAGNYLDSALAYAAKNGIATRATVPQHKIKESQWDAAYKQERTIYIPSEWWDLDGRDVWQSTVTALLLGYGCYVGLDWWSHAVWYDRMRISDRGAIEIHTPNSHGPGEDVWLSQSKATPGMGSFVLRTVTWHE